MKCMIMRTFVIDMADPDYLPGTAADAGNNPPATRPEVLPEYSSS